MGFFCHGLGYTWVNIAFCWIWAHTVELCDLEGKFEYQLLFTVLLIYVFFLTSVLLI